MNEMIRNIIKEEFEKILSKRYSDDDISDAILKKHFIHTKKGKVYSPVKLDKGFVVGVNSECEHINVPLEEVAHIQSATDRFGK